MGRKHSVRLDQDIDDATDTLVQDGVYSDKSEAIRQLARAELSRQGVLGGSRGSLSKVADEFAKAFAWIGVGWLALTVVYPVEYRLGAVFAFVAALGCVAVARLSGMDVGVPWGEKA